jgi:uncharacterized protein YecE (DUF72 family)
MPSKSPIDLRIGTAGWTIPKQHAPHFPASGSHLERCSQGFSGIEINSSFHRPHQQKTWQRWAASTPAGFRFSVKLPKAITHTAKLANCGALLQDFLDQARALGDKLGPLLVQLPPSLEYNEGLAHEFFTTLRELHPQATHTGFVALEPRNGTWFTAPADRLLRSFEIARVAAHPPKGSPIAAKLGGWPGLTYRRLHGAPRTYYSAYESAFLHALAAEIRASPRTHQWVIFDNTALGHATANALELKRLLSPPPAPPSAAAPSPPATRPAKSARHAPASSR